MSVAGLVETKANLYPRLGIVQREIFIINALGREPSTRGPRVDFIHTAHPIEDNHHHIVEQSNWTRSRQRDLGNNKFPFVTRPPEPTPQEQQQTWRPSIFVSSRPQEPVCDAGEIGAPLPCPDPAHAAAEN